MGRSIIRRIIFRLVTSLIIGLCFSHIPVYGQSNADTSEALPSPRGALIRSAVLPGWGQLYTEHYLKSAGFLAAHAYLAYRFYEKNQDLGDIRDETKKARAEFNRNTWAWRFLAAYLLCITDAYVDAHLAGFPEDNGLSLNVSPRDHGWAVQLGYSF